MQNIRVTFIYQGHGVKVKVTCLSDRSRDDTHRQTRLKISPRAAFTRGEKNMINPFTTDPVKVLQFAILV